MRKIASLILSVWLIGSVALTGWAAVQIAQDPNLRPLIARSSAEIRAATDRAMAHEATAEALSALIHTRLAKEPRNWVALQALAEVAQDRALPLPPEYHIAWNEASGIIAQSSDCLSCIWDITQCTVSTAMICKAPILLTPVEDLRGLAKAGYDYTTGAEIDRLDLGLSILGLGATGLVVASGGSSVFLKAGSASVKLARGMGRLSAPLTIRLSHALSDGIRWSELGKLRQLDDIPGLLRMDIIGPASHTISDLGRMAKATDATTALHLLPLVDDANEARHIANIAEALGPRTIGTAEVLGKSRLMRLGARLGSEAFTLMSGIIGLIGGLAIMIANTAQGLGLRLLRRIVRGRIVRGPDRAGIVPSCSHN